MHCRRLLLDTVALHDPYRTTSLVQVRKHIHGTPVLTLTLQLTMQGSAAWIMQQHERLHLLCHLWRQTGCKHQEHRQQCTGDAAEDSQVDRLQYQVHLETACSVRCPDSCPVACCCQTNDAEGNLQTVFAECKGLLAGDTLRVCDCRHPQPATEHDTHLKYSDHE